MPSLSFLLASNRDIQIVIKIVFVFFQKFKIHLIGRLSLVFQVGNLTGDAGTIPLLQRLEAIWQYDKFTQLVKIPNILLGND